MRNTIYQLMSTFTFRKALISPILVSRTTFSLPLLFSQTFFTPSEILPSSITDWDALIEKSVWYPLEASSVLLVKKLLMNLSKADPMVSSILFNMLSVLEIIVCAQLKPLVTEVAGKLSILDNKATYLLLILLQLKTLFGNENGKDKLCISGNNIDIFISY